MNIKVQLLGQPRVLSPTDANLPLGKPLALLVYLIDQGPSTRDHLADLLWPASDRSRGRASVRQALWLLKQRLGDQVFAMDDPVALSTEHVTTDLDDLIRVLDSPRMDPETLDTLMGEPLEGLTVSNAPAWRHWAEDFRSRTAHRIASRLGAQGEVRAVQGDPAAACQCLRLALRIQPDRVETHLALISHLLDLRAFDEAEAQIETVRRMGDVDATGLVAPWEERLRALRMSQVPAGKPEIHLDFVGRSRETSALTAKLRKAASGQGQVAVVTGPAGIGKTRLVEELALVAQIDGMRVVRAKAHDAERKVKLGVMADLIREFLQLPGSAGVSGASDDVLRSFLPSLHTRSNGNGTPKPQESRSSVSLGDAFLDLVDAVSGEHPTLIILEDLHWADEDTRSLVSRLGRRFAGTSALLIVTSRTSSDPALVRTLDGLSSGTHAERLDLGPLRIADTEELLGLLAEFQSSEELAALAARLQAVSGGNPLFLAETLRTLQDNNLLLPAEDGRWVFLETEVASVELPPTLREALLGRVEQLSVPGLQAASSLARLGRPSSPDALGLSPDPEGLLHELLDAGIVRWTDDGRMLDFVHDEIREAVRTTGDPTPRFPRWILAAGIVLAAAAGTLWWGVRGPDMAAAATSYPYGGGEVWTLTPEGWAAYRVTSTALEPVVVGARAPADDPSYHLRPHPTAVQPLVWMGQLSVSLEAPPAALLLQPDGTQQVLMDRASDDVAVGISPDGQTALVHSDDPDSAGYRLDMWMVSTETGQATLFRSRMNGAYWSWDGLRILGLSPGPPDTVRVMRPDGAVELTTVWGTAEFRDWCGPDHFVVIDTGTGSPTIHLVRVDGSISNLPLDLAPGSLRAACSPDGSAVIYPSLADGVVGHSLHDLATGESRRLDLGSVIYLRWFPDSIAPVPTSVRIAVDTLRIAWGSEADLEATVEFTDGSARTMGLEWASADDQVAAVYGDGTIAANSVGVTEVTASVSGWHADTATVVVTGSEDPGAALLDDLSQLSEEDWYLVGVPTPLPVVRGTDSVLWLRGDGRYSDGMISRETLDGPTGLTAEVQFRLPLTRRDQQRIELCLNDAEPPSGAEAGPSEWASWLNAESWCVQYPGAELWQFDPGQLMVHSRTSHQSVRVDGQLPSEDWVHLGLQVRPDGYAQIFVNRELVHSTRVRIPDFNERQWRVMLRGASVDTELLVKDLVVWPRARLR